MRLRTTPLIVHLLGAAGASALLAFWALRLLAPAPHVMPAAAVAPAPAAPDARLAARLFGGVSSEPIASERNIQVSGVYADGAGSSAIIAVDGKPARTTLLGREAASGVRLVAVDREGAWLEVNHGPRAHFDVPPITLAKSTEAVPLFRREGDTLTAPSQEVAADAHSAAPPGAAQARPVVGPRSGTDFGSRHPGLTNLGPAGGGNAGGSPGGPNP